METAKLKRFAQFARRSLMEQVSAKLKLVLAENSAARRENLNAIKKLEEAIKEHSKEQVVERVAYIWFNRFCALRFMDVNRYTHIGVVSPAEGQFQPEILAEAKMGHIDEEMVHDKVRQHIFALLDGKAPSRDPQGEAYRLLVVAACNFWNKVMPFLFQRIDDYTELLMPDDLLSGNSILAYTREAMTPDACEDVEVIGWLYQFYISEKKDEVFDGLKKNKKIIPENIPAATQLFTPHWIVRYLVENSLGRLWLLNRPGSKLAEKMDYYIKPEQAETDFLRISKPEDVKICDPACGSGHMLTYAFDLLYAIYEEEGYEPADIPEKILTHNLYGIEIDERAGELAAFALTMKARAKQRRFFNKGIKPNICVLENIQFDDDEIKEYMDFVGRDLFSAPLQTTLHQFEEADNFGSLIRPEVTDVEEVQKMLALKNVSGQLFLSLTHQKVLKALQQSDYLSPKYHVVIANPPYMGGKGMNNDLRNFLSKEYPKGKSDLMTAFLQRSIELTRRNGYSSLVTLDSWMFLGTYSQLRHFLLENVSIGTMAYVGWNCFPQGHVYNRGTAFVLHAHTSGHFGKYVDLSNVPATVEKGALFLERKGDLNNTYLRSSNDFLDIPGNPIAFNASEAVFDAYRNCPSISEVGKACSGIQTGDNEKYLRQWYEVDIDKIGFGIKSHDEINVLEKYWLPHKKGGEFRRWYGNCDYVLNWKNDGFSIKKNSSARPQNIDRWFIEGVTWSHTSSAAFSARITEKGFSFNVEGPTYFSENVFASLGYICSRTAIHLMHVINPTIHYLVGTVSLLPYKEFKNTTISIEVVKSLVSVGRQDWNAYETSWDFASLSLLKPNCRQPTLKATYQILRTDWQKMTQEMQRLEEENNRIFIDAYGLQDELEPEVPLNEITLTCNPHYRYGNDKSEDELEALLVADTMRELVSYAVGCMFGRYALEKPGLILANQGETIEDYYKKLREPRIDTNGHEGKDKENISVDSCELVVQPSFPADDDNVIPLLDGDWFTDDIAERFRRFLRVAFGEEHYEENLRFVEKALNIKGKRNYSIRDYFLGEFYNDHVKRYKKRPIYWMFSSPKGSFNALIYMHRYRPDTVSVVLNDYLREFRTKLTSHKNHLEAVSISASASPGEKTKALKEIEKITKMVAEMEEYEREVLYLLATRRIEIDLDNGVKFNYPLFGDALRKIPGLDTVEEG
ncbi:BREX-1 system adenine-specific DNA-methyltransferase PglX [Nitrosomonas communis]|uniref:BREX-1 system adenine-specific DNA-methyltransferase PglX n=1 Tax=Nitrosomonas communis TaxID=44574 RepID=UPI003D2769C0